MNVGKLSSFGNWVDVKLTLSIDRDFFDRSTVAEEVEVHKGDIFSAGILHHSLDASVAHLAQGDIQGGQIRLNGKCIHILCEGQKGRGQGSETHVEED